MFSKLGFVCTVAIKWRFVDLHFLSKSVDARDQADQELACKAGSIYSDVDIDSALVFVARGCHKFDFVFNTYSLFD